MKIQEESVAKRKLPANLADKDLPLFQEALQREIKAAHLLEVDNARITGNSIIYKGFSVFSESFVDPSHIGKLKKKFIRIRFILKNDFFRKKLKLPEQAIWFTDNWSHEYFHWMTDALPRLFIIKEYAKSSVVLLPEKYQSIDYVQRSLRTFAPKRVIYISEKSVAKVKQLMLPTHTAPTGNYNETLILQLSQHFRLYYQSRGGIDYGDKIYISRSKALRRKIANETEVVNLLEQHGFRSVVFEDYNFDEQVSIIVKAKYLISNHGAGLTNMLFMDSESKVLELRRKGDTHNNCYFALASALGFPYFYQACESEDGNEDTFTANLVVDLEELKQNIELMLQSR